MLPAVPSPEGLISDVAENLYQALTGRVTDRGWQPVSKVAVVVIDGLGATNLMDHSGHARTLAGLLRQGASTCRSGLPSTTSTALASLTTGRQAGEHGLLGYSVKDPETGRVVNHLKPFPDGVVPDRWQPVDTVFERLGRVSIPSVAVGEGRFEGTDFSASILRGSQFAASHSLSQHSQLMREFFDTQDSGLCYLYWPGLDRVGHSKGVSSEPWLDELESVDSWVAQLLNNLEPGEAVVITADHGMVNVDDSDRVVLPANHPLRGEIEVFAGEPRALHLYVAGDDSEGFASRLSTWVADRGRVYSRTEAVAAGVFGAVRPEHLGRVGDAVVFARDRWAFYDEATASPSSLLMVGQHGSMTPTETTVPLIVSGAWDS